MVRKQFYITKEQEEHLNSMAAQTSIVSAEYLRRIIDADIERTRKMVWMHANKDKNK